MALLLFPRTSTNHWWLFAPPLFASFTSNDLVFLIRPPLKVERCYRKGIVESIDPVNKTARVQLILDHSLNSDEATEAIIVTVPLKRLVPIYTSTVSNVVVTADTRHYRNLAMAQIQDQDDVLEIGCSTGETSVLLLANANSWVGLDTSTEMMKLCTQTLNQKLQESSQKKHRHLYKVDILFHPNCALQQATKWNTHGPTVVFIDVGGNRDCTSVLKIMAWCFDSFPRLRLMVIKNEELVRDIRASSRGGTLALCPFGGLVTDGDDWYHHRMTSLPDDSLSRRRQSLHPLRAPLVMSPVDGTTPICRYHNYDPNGCKRKDICLLDHQHCHLCRQSGHTARNCNDIHTA